MTTIDLVTGASTEVELVAQLPIDRVWALVTDVSRIGEWSPECVFAAWRPDQGDLPLVGARFEARNEYADGYSSAVECVVTEAARPSVFAVLDGRLAVLRRNMTATLQAMVDHEGAGR
jgi:hypothetical protein